MSLEIQETNQTVMINSPPVVSIPEIVYEISIDSQTMAVEIQEITEEKIITPLQIIEILETKQEVIVDPGIIVIQQFSGDYSEINLTPKASSIGPEGTIFYCSDDDHVYVATA